MGFKFGDLAGVMLPIFLHKQILFFDYYFYFLTMQKYSP